MTASVSPDPVGGSKPAETKADLEDLRHDVEDTASIAAERGKGFAAAARKQALAYVDDRKGEAARSVSDLAQSLRDSGQTFDDRPNIRAFFDSAAEGLDDLAGSIERPGSGITTFMDVQAAAASVRSAGSGQVWLASRIRPQCTGMTVFAPTASASPTACSGPRCTSGHAALY